MFIDGKVIREGKKLEVSSPYSDEFVGEVTESKKEDSHNIEVNQYNSLTIIHLLIEQKKKGREYLENEIKKLYEKV